MIWLPYVPLDACTQNELVCKVQECLWNHKLNNLQVFLCIKSRPETLVHTLFYNNLTSTSPFIPFSTLFIKSIRYIPIVSKQKTQYLHFAKGKRDIKSWLTRDLDTQPAIFIFRWEILIIFFVIICLLWRCIIWLCYDFVILFIIAQIDQG